MKINHKKEYLNYHLIKSAEITFCGRNANRVVTLPITEWDQHNILTRCKICDKGFSNKKEL